MKKSVVIILHFAYWLLYLLLLGVLFSILNFQIKKTFSFSFVLTILPLLILCLVPNLISFYLFYFPLFTRFLAQKKIPALIIAGAMVNLISSLSGSLISAFIIGINQPIFTDRNEFLSLTVSLFLIALIHGVIALIIRGFITWFEEIKLKKELAQKNYETELALIKSQINPHFLFNTLNNIDVLISKDSVKASEYLNKLSDILRYLLYEANTEKILLDQELKYLEKYLELQKIRTTNPNYVKLEIIGRAGQLQIAPMIFFPFVENAFKHTENNKSSNSINLKLVIKNHKIIFDCKNTYQKRLNGKQDFGGLGNELIAKRLNLLYPAKHSLEITDNESIYQIILTIDLI